MPNASDKTNPYAVPLDTRPGEHTALAWDPANQTVEWAQVVCRRIRSAGGVVVSCSLDELVKKGRTCPVCGAAGLA